MAFNVGAIVAKLTLDKSKWDQSVKGVGTDQSKMQGMSDATAGKFRKIGTAMTVAGGVVIGALGAMTKKFIDTGDWIDKMSKRTGFSAESLSELAYAADLSGASLNDVERGVKRMAGSILDAHSGLESYARAFRVLGVSVDDLMKMNPEEQFLTISEAIAKIEDPTIRAALAQDVFGRAGTALLPMMSDGAEGLRKMRQEARDLGIIFTNETAASAAELKDSQTALKESVKGLSMAFTEHLVPVLTNIVQSITAGISKVTEWARENPQLASTVIKVAAALGSALLVLGPMVIMVPKLVAGVKLLAGGFTSLISPVGLLTAALAALALGYMKVKAAQDKANEAARNAAEAEDNLFQKLKKAADAAGLSEKEFLKLRDAYHGNAAAMAMAIQRGQEGKELQEALTKVSKEHKDEIDKQKDALKDTGPVMDDLTGRFQGYLSELTKTKDETKTWVDYLQSLGLKTVKEKSDRVTELTKYLEDLKTAYDNNLISLKEYVEGTNAATREVEELSTTIVTQTLPAARSIPAVWNIAATEIETRTGAVVIDTKKKTKQVGGIWYDCFNNITSNVKGNLTDMLAGHQSFKDGISNIWDNLKTSLIGVFVDIAVSYAAQFVAPLLAGATKAVDGILSSFGGLGGGLSGIFKGITGAGGAATGLWTGLGAAAGTFLGSLFGKKAAGFDKHDSGNLQELRDIARNHRDLMRIDFTDMTHEMINHLIAIREYTDKRIPEKQDFANNQLVKIKDFTHETANRLKDVYNAIKNITSAQTGAVFTGPELAVMHGTPASPEIAAPVQDVMKFAAMGQKSAGGSLNQNINIAIHVMDQLDPFTAQKIVRNQIVPETLKAIELDARNKAKLRDILGVQL